MAVFFAVSFAALAAGASLHIKLKPKHPKGKHKYTLTIKGTAVTGVYGASGNESALYRYEQLGGTCASTPDAEASQAGLDLGTLFVGPGPFTVKQKRKATSKGTKIRFCVYLEHAPHTLDASATTAYKAR